MATRAFHRSPSKGAVARAGYGVLTAAAAGEDAEVGLCESPKKGDIPSHRRKGPFIVMLSLLAATLIAGVVLIFTHQSSAEDVSSGGHRREDMSRTAKDLEEGALGNTLVEFTVPGLIIPIKDALRLEFPVQPEEKALFHFPTGTSLGATASLHDYLHHLEEESTATAVQGHTRTPSDANSQASNSFQVHQGRKQLDVHAPPQNVSSTLQGSTMEKFETLRSSFSTTGGPEDRWILPGGVNLLVAVTSACCTPVSLQRRAAIRRTWGALSKERYPTGVDIRFYLSQPGTNSSLKEWLPALEEEQLMFNDTVVVRGEDAYLNLPNKTFRMFRYALAHPAGYTHVLKVDDDVWLRMHKVMEVLLEEEPLHKAINKLQGAQAAAALHAGRRLRDAAAAAEERKKELERKSTERGVPVVSESMSLYDASSIVLRFQTPGSKALPTDSVDDIDGSELTLEEMARRAGWRIRSKQEASSILREGTTDGNDAGNAGSTGVKNGIGGQAGAGRRKVEGIPSGRNRSRRNLQQTPASQQIATPNNTFSALMAPSMKIKVPNYSRLRTSGVYLGCVEVRSGFHPVRDPGSKWYVSESDLPDSAVPQGVQYNAGWGYLLSRDLIQHMIEKVNAYEQQPEHAPLWYKLVHWEDVLVGLLLSDVVDRPQSHPSFRPAWRSCAPGTAVRHLDIDSPRLLKALVEQDVSGLADEKPVQCSSGQFLPGDYAGWAAWKAKFEREKEIGSLIQG